MLGRRSILQGIEEFYGTIPRPSIWTAQLGTTAQTDGRDSEVFTERGYANGSTITSIEEIRPQFHPHWNAVEQAGFLPEVRRTSGNQDGGSWLLLRKPSLEEVARHWFGYQEGSLGHAVEEVADGDKEVQRRNLRRYRMLGEKAVDQALDIHRPRGQIGLILSMAAIKLALGDKSGYEEEVDDAFIYADNDTSIDASAVRAIENSTFEVA